MNKGAYMAMHGQHREAQAYAKNWNRKMNKGAHTSLQKEDLM